MIDLLKINTQGGTQPRAELNQSTVDEYAEAYRAGATLPPVTLFFDGSQYWLADGFHRYFAAKAAGKKSIPEEVTPGTLREAILYSLSANSKHGLKRSNADKRRAVETLLKDAEWGLWSDHELARRCAVSASFVGDVRKSHCSPTTVRNQSSLDENQVTKRTVTTKHGTTTTMNTANVGKKSGAKSAEPEKAAASEPAPYVEPIPEYTALDAANDQISELQDALAMATAAELTPEDKAQASALIARLREEVKTLTASLKAVTASRDHYQAENGELKQQIRLQRREIDKLAGTKTA